MAFNIMISVFQYRGMNYKTVLVLIPLRHPDQQVLCCRTFKQNFLELIRCQRHLSSVLTSPGSDITQADQICPRGLLGHLGKGFKTETMFAVSCNSRSAEDSYFKSPKNFTRKEASPRESRHERNAGGNKSQPTT